MKPIVPDVATYLLTHALTVMTAIASVVMAVRLLDSRRTPQSTLAWLLGLALMPFVTIPLYLLIGTRKFPRRAKRAEGNLPKGNPPSKEDFGGSIGCVLRTSGVAPPRHGNSFHILPTGEEAYERLMELVRAATHSIDLTMFILGADVTGDAFVSALAERAKQGVSVRLILDAVGSSRSCRHANRVLSAAGAEVRVFMPLRHSLVKGRTNLRSHRKLGIFDREHVFAGGMNLANEYMGLPQDPGARPRWKDVAAVTTGPVAADAEELFESDWRFCGGSPRKAPIAPRYAVGVAPGDATVQLVPSGPDMLTDTVYDLFLTAIFAARKSIAIVTPYYVPDEQLQHALILAGRRGIGTEVLVPRHSNHRIADIARRDLLHDLSAAGVAVHYYVPGMVHAKAMVVDDTFAYIGSPNFDQRSLFLNYEDALCVYSPGAISQIRSFVDGLMGGCTAEAPPEHAHWVTELARLLAPEL